MSDDEFDDDAFLAEWAEAEAATLDDLRDALAEHRNQPPPQPDLADASARARDGLAADAWPYATLSAVGGLPTEPGDLAELADDELVIAVAGAWAIGRGEPDDEQIEISAAVASLQLGDWFGAVTGAVRGGPGTLLHGDAVIELIRACPEIDSEGVDPDDEAFVASAFELQLPAWRAAGVADDDDRLTPLGAWILPRLAATMWGGDFDDDGPGERRSPARRDLS